MVKHAEKVRKRSPLLPVFGLILAIALFIVAYGLVEPVRAFANQRFAGGSFALPDPKYFLVTQTNPADPKSPTKIIIPSTARLGVAFAFWLILLALSYTLVAVLAGRDPNSAKNIQLPPRTKEEKDRRY